MTINWRRTRRKHANSGSFFCRFDSAPCLLWANGWDPSQQNQGLKSFPLCRNDFPLPPPINRGGFHGLREETIGSKVRQKTSFSSDFCTFLLFLSLHRGLQPPPPSSPVFPPSPSSQEANTTTSQPPRATVGLSLLSAAPPARFSSLICFLCRRPPSLSQPQPPSSRQTLTVSTTNRPPM